MLSMKIGTLTRFVTDNNEWFAITGVLVSYESVLYVSTMSVTPQSLLTTFLSDHLFCALLLHSTSV